MPPCCTSTSTCTLTESCSLLALEAGVSLPATACHAHRTFGGPCVWAGRRRGCVEAPNTSACVPLLTPSAAARSAVRELPNVLFILTDQQATWTVGAYHRQFTRLRADGRDSSAWAQELAGATAPVPTPHLDRLADDGALFTNFVVSAPWCVPSRAALLSGREAERATHPTDRYGEQSFDMPGSQDFWGGRCLPFSAETFASAFGRAGYTTSYIGKYHLLGGEGVENGGESTLACLPTIGPTQPRPPGTHGWNDTRYMIGPGHPKTIIDADEWGGKRPRVLAYDAAAGRCTDRGIRFQEAEHLPHLRVSLDPPCAQFAQHYTTAALGRFARKRMRAFGGRRWLIMLSLHDPHPDFITMPPYDTKFRGSRIVLPASARDPTPVVGPGNRRNLPGSRYTQIRAWYMGMCGAIDDAVGEIVGELEALDQAENTLTIFTSDHGELMMAHGSMLKGVMYDEVVRVPMIVHWPAGVRRGTIVEHAASSIDVWSTMAGLLGVGAPDVTDGTDLSPLLREPDAGARWAGADYRIVEQAGGGFVGLWSPNHVLLLAGPYFASRMVWTKKADYQDRGLCGLWDRQSDPAQMTNLCDDPAHAATAKGLLTVAHGYLRSLAPPRHRLLDPSQGGWLTDLLASKGVELPPPSPQTPPPPPTAPPPPICDSLVGRTNARRNAEPKWCFELESDCDSYYTTSINNPGQHRLCVAQEGGHGCDSTASFYCDEPPTLPPPPPAPPAPPVAPPPPPECRAWCADEADLLHACGFRMCGGCEWCAPCALPIPREGGPRHFLGAAPCEEIRGGDAPPAAVPDFADGSAPEAACDAAYAVARAGRGFGPCVWRDGGCVNRAEDPYSF